MPISSFRLDEHNFKPSLEQQIINVSLPKDSKILGNGSLPDPRLIFYLFDNANSKPTEQRRFFIVKQYRGPQERNLREKISSTQHLKTFCWKEEIFHLFELPQLEKDLFKKNHF